MILYLQQFIYNKLDNNLIKDQVKGIYYQVPSNSYFPYIYIGDFISKDRSVRSQKIFHINFKIVIYLRDKSLKSALKISQDIKNMLDVNGEGDIAFISFVEEKIMMQNDGVTTQVNIKFKAVVR